MTSKFFDVNQHRPFLAELFGLLKPTAITFVVEAHYTFELEALYSYLRPLSPYGLRVRGSSASTSSVLGGAPRSTCTRSSSGPVALKLHCCHYRVCQPEAHAHQALQIPSFLAPICDLELLRRQPTSTVRKFEVLRRQPTSTVLAELLGLLC